MAYLTNKIIHPDSKAFVLSHPWTIHLSKNETGRTVFGVEYQSDVYDGVSWDKKTVTGLVEKKDDKKDPGWKIPTRDSYIFLWGEIKEDGSVGKIEVKNDQTDLENIYRVNVENGKQTHFAHTLGYIWKTSKDQESDNWLVRQDANRHLTLLYVVVNGVLCKVPFEM